MGGSQVRWRSSSTKHIAASTPRLLRRVGTAAVALVTLLAGVAVVPHPAGASVARHGPAGPRHNSRPLVPTGPTIDSCYLVCASPAKVRSGKPMISVTVSDPDGGSLLIKYQVVNEAKTAVVAKSGSAVTGVASGTAQGWQIIPTSGSTLADGTYHWRARACDSYVCGGHSAWFTFTVDSQPVPSPTVSGTPYLERSTGTWNGGPGQPGTFTFGPNGGADVAEYIYILNEGNAVTVPATSPVQTITPTRDGPNVLEVWSRNTVGISSEPTVYQFLVTPSTGEWRWTFDQDTGTSTASEPVSHPASLSPNGVTWTSPGYVGAGAMTFDGAGELTTSSPVLDTNNPAGFTVAAWVRLTDPTGRRAAVSQDGVNASMFELGFRDDRDVDGDGASDPAWCFSVRAADTPESSASTACINELVFPDQWVALVGVYNRPTNSIQLYVGTNEVGPILTEEAHTGGWASTGAFAIGRAQQDAAPADRWVGDLDHVHAAQFAWSMFDAAQFSSH